MPDRLLDIAKELLDTTPLDQPRLRSVVNRAYYAAFLTARSCCAKHELATGVGASHEKVINALLDKPRLCTYGNQLNDIKRLRHQADYNWDRDTTLRDARKSLKTCSELVASFKLLDPPSN